MNHWYIVIGRITNNSDGATVCMYHAPDQAKAEADFLRDMQFANISATRRDICIDLVFQCGPLEMPKQRDVIYEAIVG